MAMGPGSPSCATHTCTNIRMRTHTRTRNTHTHTQKNTQRHAPLTRLHVLAVLLHVAAARLGQDDVVAEVLHLHQGVVEHLLRMTQGDGMTRVTRGVRYGRAWCEGPERSRSCRIPPRVAPRGPRRPRRLPTSRSPRPHTPDPKTQTPNRKTEALASLHASLVMLSCFSVRQCSTTPPQGLLLVAHRPLHSAAMSCAFEKGRGEEGGRPPVRAVGDGRAGKRERAAAEDRAGPVACQGPAWAGAARRKSSRREGAAAASAGPPSAPPHPGTPRGRAPPRRTAPAAS
jgi:hypothetical protein